MHFWHTFWLQGICCPLLINTIFPVSEHFSLVIKYTQSHLPNWCIEVCNTPKAALLVGNTIFFCNQTWQGQSVMFTLKLLLLKKTLRLLFMDGVQLSQGYRASTRRQFTFYYSAPWTSRYLFNQPCMDERLSWLWIHPAVLNLGSLDWESSSTLTTWSLLVYTYHLLFIYKQTLFNFSDIQLQQQMHFLHNPFFIHSSYKFALKFDKRDICI